MVRSMLEKLGHMVKVAGDGRQVLESLTIERFDRVLMDVQMPVREGVEATKAIRQGEV